MRKAVVGMAALLLAGSALLWAATAAQNPTGLDASWGTWSSTAYTQVNDHPDASCASVVTCTALGSSPAACQLTWTFAAFSVPAGSTGISVDVLYYDKDASSGTNNEGARLKVGGSYYNATTHNPATTCTSRDDAWATNPKTSAAWTAEQVNGTDASNPLQAFGINSTDTTPNIQLGSIRLQVTYTAPGSKRAQTIIAGVMR